MSLLERLEEKKLQAQKQEETISGAEVLSEAAKNLPASAQKLVADVTFPIRHPIETAQSLASLGRGVVKLIAPGEPTFYDEDEEAAKAVGKFFADRYGSFEGFKKSFATDPLGVLSDVAVVFTGGAGLAAKVPGIAGKTTQAISKVGSAIDPVLGGAKLIGATAAGASKVAAPLFGLTTGAGTDAIKVAAKSGASSPEVQKMFLDNLRGNVAPEEIVPKAIGALKERKTKTRGRFRKDKKTLQLESLPVDFSKIQQAIKSFEESYKFEGVSELSKKAQTKLSDLKKIVQIFEENPKLHNAKGLDILKRRIDAEYPTGLNVGDSGIVVTELRNVVKSKILDEVPEYSKVMKDYELAINLERQFMQELSLGKNKAAGTTLRKLQSALRNNVNTSYGNRLNMVKDLDPNLITEIGGQALSSITPRGLQGLSAGTVAAYGYFVDPLTLAALPLQSPRLVGETAFKLGQLEKSLQGLRGQTALDIARGTRLVGEVVGADDVDNAELLKILLDSKDKEKTLDTTDINTIKKGATELTKEFAEEDKDDNKTFALGGTVEMNNENIADTIMRKLSISFTTDDLQREKINKQIVPLQRISKDAKSNKYRDQVFVQLDNYSQRLEAELNKNKSVELQRFKNIVDRAIDNKIDEGFIADDEDLQDQLQFAPNMYKKYIGLDDSDEPFEARDKTANKILEKIINKKYNPAQTSNYLISHNKFAPKNSVPLFINKLAETLSEAQFENVETTLKDAMLIKLFEPNTNKSNNNYVNKYEMTLEQNKDVFDSLFTKEELADLKSFKENVIPAITKNITLNPNQSKYLFASALAEARLLGKKRLMPTADSVEIAKSSLKKLQKPLLPDPQIIEPELVTEIVQSQDMVERTAPDVDIENLQSQLNTFEMPSVDQDLFQAETPELTAIEMTSPTILPDERDREIAMRRQAGIAGLV
jgi:hypothetical protein